MYANLAADAAKVAPLASAAWYLQFVSEYGATLVTSLAIVYGLMGLVVRAKEIYDKFKEKRNGSK